jgi:hypothetical protein
MASRLGARAPMTTGAVLAPAGMFWLSRVSAHSHYLTGVGLPLIVFAAAAGLIFVPLNSLSRAAAGHGLARHGLARHAAAHPVARPGSPIYDHALSSGVTTALTIGAGATVLALIAIRVRREDLPATPLVM